jgi:uncharacterized protein
LRSWNYCRSRALDCHMPRSLVILHGGTTFDTSVKYIAYLKKRAVSADNFKPRSDWKDAAVKKLGRKYDIFLPQMPNKTSARYEEWKIWFERMLPFVGANSVLVGHSLGGIFLVKYLSERKLKKKLRALVLVAAPFDDTEGETLADFRPPRSLRRISAQAKEVYIAHSSDDPVVPYAHARKYLDNIPRAKLLTFHDRGHFNQKNFPELFRLLSRLR